MTRSFYTFIPVVVFIWIDFDTWHFTTLWRVARTKGARRHGNHLFDADDVEDEDENFRM